MSDVVIKVEQLSKQYRLGEMGTGTISHDLNRWWHKIRGKEDPYLKVGEVNDRTTKGESEYVWAMRNVNFEVKRGEVLGIIGKNGAGKSTLLKMLSRVTSPTTGRIRTKGRIASLLEVGTGFHDELTGRENIFLNGAIMGMTKAEIRAKLDEIVNFSGTERYLDTPVKRYSSGMRVRLGFAVAAHLEPEILIVDEVLAVGDAEFQKKAIGKMQDVSQKGGRTVLFVSHNMGSIAQLCTRGLLLQNGTVIMNESINVVIDKYLEKNVSVSALYSCTEDPLKNVQILSVQALDSEGRLSDNFAHNEEIYVKIKLKKMSNDRGIVCSIGLQDQLDRKIFVDQVSLETQQGFFLYTAKLPVGLFRPNKFKVSVALHIPNIQMIEVVENVIGFELIDKGSEFSIYGNVDNGFLVPTISWQVQKDIA